MTSPAQQVHVMFVCLGNICRSPTAQGVFQTRLRARGLAEAIAVESCGTSNWHIGEPPDSRAIEAAALRDYDLSRLRGRQIQPSDFIDFDYILAMDDDNLHALHAMRPHNYAGHLSLFLDFAHQTTEREVPDPYYGGSGGFSHVLDLIEDACEGLIDAIIEQGGLDAHSAR